MEFEISEISPISNNQALYYYGIDNSQVCDENNKCFELVTALKHNQISIESIKKYLEKNYILGNNEKYILYAEFDI